MQMLLALSPPFAGIWLSCSIEGGGGTKRVRVRLGIWAPKMSMGGIFLQAHRHGESSSPPEQWRISYLVAGMLMAQGLGRMSCWRGHPAARAG